MMKKSIQVKESNNAFTIKIDGNPSNTLIFDGEGNLLRTSLVNSPHFLTHLCIPGDYFIETDGEILDIKIENIKQIPVMFDALSENLDQTNELAEWYDTGGAAEKLRYIKEELIQHLHTIKKHMICMRKLIIEVAWPAV